MANYGTYYRAQPRVRVPRGYPGNEPTNKSRSAPVSSGVTILSGQVISLSSGAWVLGCPNGSEPFIAFHDSTDPDVIQSGFLLGFSCSGNYEITTPYFTLAAGNYAGDNIPLAADSGATVVSPPSGAGNLILTTLSGGKDLLGFTANGGLQNITTTNSEALPTGTPPALYALTFGTNWQPLHS